MKSFVCNLLLVAVIDRLICVRAGDDDSARADSVEETVFKIGDRVMRGKDWQYENEDGGPGSVGTITAFEQDGFATVEWDNKEQQMYRIGTDGLYELKLAPNSTRPTTTTTENLYFDFESKPLTLVTETLDEDDIVTSNGMYVFTSVFEETYDFFSTTNIDDSDESENGVNAASVLDNNNINRLIIISCLFLFILLTH